MKWIFQYLKSAGDNFGKVSSFLYRSAQPSKDDLLHYKRNINLKNIINLRADLPSKHEEEALSLNLAFFNFPMEDNIAPTLTQVDAILFIIRDYVIDKSTTLICCKDRVRYDDGWTKEKAWKEGEKYGWYSSLGHKPLKEFFFNVFEP